MNRFIDSAIFVSCFAAILYCAYSRYNIGFLNEFGVFQDLLDRNLNQILFYGIHLLLIPLINISFKCLFTLCVVYLILKSIKHFKGKIVTYLYENKKNIINKLELIDNFFNDFKLLKKLIFFVWCSIILFILLVYGFQYFQNLGSEQAKKMYSDINNGKYNGKKITINNGEDKVQLILISCGNSNCVGLDDVNKKLYYFPANTKFYSDVRNKEISE